MTEQTKAETREKQKSSGPMVTRGRLLPFRKEHRTNPQITSGAHAMRRAYFCNGLSRRVREGKIISQMEREFAEHCGFPSLQQTPVTLRLKIQLLIGNLIFLALYDPPADSKNGLRDFHCAQNLVNRLSTELGLERRPKDDDPMRAIREKMQESQ